MICSTATTMGSPIILCVYPHELFSKIGCLDLRFLNVVSEELLDSALRLLSENGLDGFSLHKLARAVGLTVGALYRYFPSKGALIAALEDRVIEETARRLERVLEVAAEDEQAVAPAAGW